MPSTDYAKLKNAELESLLKERSLPHTGKKAEMVSRLQQDDKRKAGGQDSIPAPAQQTEQPTIQQPEDTAKASKGTAMTAAEDEIDWDDDDAVAIETEKPDAATTTIKSTKDNQPDGSKTNGTVTTAEKNDTDSATNAASAPAEGEGDGTPTAPAPDTFTSGLAATTIEEELAKRRARAKKFGLADESEQDAIKALERAKRFGETTAGPRGLNEALPERMAKNHKKRGRGDRGDEDGYEGQRNGGGRRFGGGKGRFRNKGRRNGGGGGGRGDSNSKAAWMSVTDRERAEARQKRFAAS